MRRGLFKRMWIENEANELIGVSLGSDYAAEHEWGIKDLRMSFGVKKSTIEKRMLGLKSVEVPLFGIAIRTIHENPTSFFEKNGTYLLGYTDGNPKFLESMFETEKNHLERSPEGFIGLWDGRSFALLSKDKEKMESLRDAFAENDIAIFLGASEVFSNGNGLNLCIVSKMPTEVLDGMLASDMEAHQLRVDMDKTGIEQKLIKANKRYYALSPRRTKGNIKFWLNPVEQKKYEAGWYTVEELEQWINDEGPVMKINELKPNKTDEIF